MSSAKPATTIAVLLGASQYPGEPELTSSSAFAGAARQLHDYLTGSAGLALSEVQILDLFDDGGTVIDQIDKLANHLTKWRDASNLVLIYVGHGGFLPDQEYFLAIRSTKATVRSVSALRIKALAQCIDENFGRKRVFLILDCCFAGEAVAEFMSGGVAAVVERETFRPLPEAGTSLLVAASRNSPAINPHESDLTMFSGCLLDVLVKGVEGSAERLSLSDVGDAVAKCVRHRFGQRGVLPEVHSPRQDAGNVARLPIFPNPGWRPSRLPRSVVDALTNPLAGVRLGAIPALRHYLAAEDAGLAQQAERELKKLSELDDSNAVRSKALQTLARRNQMTTRGASAPELFVVPDAHDDTADDEISVSEGETPPNEPGGVSHPKRPILRWRRIFLACALGTLALLTTALVQFSSAPEVVSIALPEPEPITEPPSVAPASPSVDPAEPSVVAPSSPRGADWILQQAPESYSIQILSTGGPMEMVVAFCRQRGMCQASATYSHMVEGSTKRVLLYGIYPDFATATAHKDKVREMAGRDVWVQPIGLAQRRLVASPVAEER